MKNFKDRKAYNFRILYRANKILYLQNKLSSTKKKERKTYKWCQIVFYEKSIRGIYR